MNIKNRQFIKRSLVIVSVAVVFSMFFMPQVSFAAEKKGSDINDAAAKYCKAKYDGKDAQEGACRNGWRGAYSSEAVSTACGVDRVKPYETQAEKRACEAGHADGTETKKQDTTAKDPNRDPEAGSAADVKDKGDNFFSPTAASEGGGYCGNEKAGGIKTRFNFGCIGNEGPENMGPLEDFAYAVIRFLTAGVGIVIVLFIIIAGIQYSSSEGNADKTQEAKNKIRDAIIGLFVYLIAFALVQFLVPGGVFTGAVADPPTLAIVLGENNA